MVKISTEKIKKNDVIMSPSLPYCVFDVEKGKFVFNKTLKTESEASCDELDEIHSSLKDFREIDQSRAEKKYVVVDVREKKACCGEELRGDMVLTVLRHMSFWKNISLKPLKEDGVIDNKEKEIEFSTRRRDSSFIGVVNLVEKNGKY